MNKSVSNSITIIIIGIIISACANRGTIGGGEKDTEPPVIIRSVPENFSTNFTGDEIKIYFDEYIKIKDVQKQLIISPPMKTQPEITPLGAASKYITIKIYDTLQPNTTYAFNFGQSIVDNNEGNPYPFHKYVFSTGDYIDSLTVKGDVLDAEKRKVDNFVSVLLYEIDSTFTDSIIYKEYPKYITNTLDSTTTFSLENLKAGQYMLVALKDENNSNKFEQKADRIGFKKEFITIPTDSLYTLKLFKETPDFRVVRPKQVAGQKIAFGYEGDIKNLNINLRSQTPANFEKRLVKDSKADTLYYWYTPKIEADSLLFSIKNKKYQDSLYIKIRDMKKDTLVISAVKSGTLKLSETLEIEGSIPFKSINNERITILDKDSLNINFKTQLDSLNNKYIFNFDKKEDNNYNIQMLPGALSDLFENTNDTLNYNVRTKNVTDYGKLRVVLNNAVFPVIVQLTDKNDVVKAALYSDTNQPFDFDNLEKGQYYIRVIYDSNKNRKWDTGNYLKKIQPERIIYHPKAIDIRANWDWTEEFTLN